MSKFHKNFSFQIIKKKKLPGIASFSPPIQSKSQRQKQQQHKYKKKESSHPELNIHTIMCERVGT